MEIAESGVVDGVNYRDYLSLISNLGQVKQLIPDDRAYREAQGRNTMHYVSRDGKVRLGLGRNSRDKRLFYWVFGKDDLVVSKISEIINSLANTDPRRN
ncbi:MAG: hypothetical protein ACP5N7_01390 [Candidatus Pacearchaeota archaeon]